MKRKTNISVMDNLGIRREVNMQVGEDNGYLSGDILDANATSKLVEEKASNIASDIADQKINNMPEKTTEGYTFSDTSVNWLQKRYYKCSTVSDETMQAIEYGSSDWNVMFDGDNIAVGGYKKLFTSDSYYTEEDIVSNFNSNWNTFQDIDDNYFDEDAVKGVDYYDIDPAKPVYVIVTTRVEGMHDKYLFEQGEIPADISEIDLYHYTTNMKFIDAGVYSAKTFTDYVDTDDETVPQSFIIVNDDGEPIEYWETVSGQDGPNETATINYKFTPVARKYIINTDRFILSDQHAKFGVGTSSNLVMVDAKDIIEFISWAKTNQQGPWEPASETQQEQS